MASSPLPHCGFSFPVMFQLMPSSYASVFDLRLLWSFVRPGPGPLAGRTRGDRSESEICGACATRLVQDKVIQTRQRQTPEAIFVTIGLHRSTGKIFRGEDLPQRRSFYIPRS